MSGLFGLLTLSCTTPQQPSIPLSNHHSHQRFWSLSGFQLQKDFGAELSHISRVHSYNNKNNDNVQHLHGHHVRVKQVIGITKTHFKVIELRLRKHLRTSLGLHSAGPGFVCNAEIVLEPCLKYIRLGLGRLRVKIWKSFIETTMLFP